MRKLIQADRVPIYAASTFKGLFDEIGRTIQPYAAE